MVRGKPSKVVHVVGGDDSATEYDGGCHNKSVDGVGGAEPARFEQPSCAARDSRVKIYDTDASVT